MRIGGWETSLADYNKRQGYMGAKDEHVQRAWENELGAMVQKSFICRAIRASDDGFSGLLFKKGYENRRKISTKEGT